MVSWPSCPVHPRPAQFIFPDNSRIAASIFHSILRRGTMTKMRTFVFSPVPRPSPTHLPQLVIRLIATATEDKTGNVKLKNGSFAAFSGTCAGTIAISLVLFWWEHARTTEAGNYQQKYKCTNSLIDENNHSSASSSKVCWKLDWIELSFSRASMGADILDQTASTKGAKLLVDQMIRRNSKSFVSTILKTYFCLSDAIKISMMISSCELSSANQHHLSPDFQS